MSTVIEFPRQRRIRMIELIEHPDGRIEFELSDKPLTDAQVLRLVDGILAVITSRNETQSR